MYMSMIYIWLWVMIWPALHTSTIVKNNVLKIVVLDVDRNRPPNSSQLEFNITGRTDTKFGVVQWNEVSTDPKDIQSVKHIFNQSDSVLLLTPSLCEQDFLLETVLPQTSNRTCVAHNGIISQQALIPCASKPKRRRRSAHQNVQSLFCLFNHDQFKKTKIILSVIRKLKWNNVIILYNNDTAFSSKIVTEKMPTNVVLTMYNMNMFIHTSGGLEELLYKIYNNTEYEGRNILLICSQTCINTVIQEANTFDKRNRGATALSVFSKWLLVDFNNETKLRWCELSLDNLAVVNFPFLDVDSTFLKRIIIDSLDASVNKVLDEYIDIREHEIHDLVLEALTNDVNNHTDCWRAAIYTLLWKAEGRVLSPVGHINYSESVYLFPDVSIYPNTEFGFNKRVFLTTTNEWTPFTIRLEKVNDKVTFDGYSIDFLNVMASSLNFSYVLTEPEDGDWGIIKNGSWTGVVGQLARREVDLFAGPLAISSDREDAIDFTFPYFHVYTCVIFRRPDPNNSKWRKLLDPFSWEVYLCLFISFTGIIIIMYTIERVNPFYTETQAERPTFQGLVLYLFGALLTQGGSSMPSSISGRSLLATWWIFCIITVAIYSGNLIAFLTVSKEKLPMETLEDMVSQTEYTWGTHGGGIWVSLLKESNVTDFKRIWKGILEFNKTDPDVFSVSQKVHLKKVKKGYYGFIADKTTAEAWIFENCEITSLKELFFPMNYAFALQNNSPYLQYFSDEVMKVYESGLGQTLKRKWWPKQNLCLESATIAKMIKLVDIQSAFYVMIIGIAVALLVIVIEQCFTRGERGFIVSQCIRRLSRNSEHRDLSS